MKLRYPTFAVNYLKITGTALLCFILAVGVDAEESAIPQDKNNEVPMVLAPMPMESSLRVGSPPQEVNGTYVSLDECLEIAVQNNLGLKISRLKDRASDLSVRTAWAQYYPEFRVGISHDNSRTTGGSAHYSENYGLTGNVVQTSPWGTTLDFSVAESRNGFDADNASGNIGVSLSQPLWKGAGTDVGLAPIRTARIGRLIARGSLELDTQTLIFNVRRNYANIVSQKQNITVNRQAVGSANKFLELTQAREQAGQVTKLDVFNAEVQLQQRKLSLISNERQLQTAFDDLKRLMDVDLDETLLVSDEEIDFGELSTDKTEDGVNRELQSNDVAGTVSLITLKNGAPAGETKILYQAIRFDPKIILQEALENRIDLLNSHRALAAQKLQTLLVKDGLGHQVDLVSSFRRTDSGRSTFEADNAAEVNSWSVGVNASIPWGKIRDRAAYERALLDLQQAEIELKRARTNVHFDVRDIMRRLDESEKTLLIEGRNVEQAKRRVEAAKISFDRGLKDSFDVIKSEDEFLSSKRDFISRKQDYVVLLAQLEVVVGKPTGRINLSGQSVGGVIDSRLPVESKDHSLPRRAPDAEPRPESDPFNKSREYRKD